MSSVCERCGRHAKLQAFAGAAGKSESLCKACLEQADIQDLLHPTTPPSPPPPIHGAVVSSAGAVRGVRVQVQGQDGAVVTDAAGRFSLRDAAAHAMASAASRLYAVLTKLDPGGGEKWLNSAAREGALPSEYVALLRKSQVGALMNHDTFVGLLNRREVVKSIAARLFGDLRQEPSLVLSFTKAGFAPFSLPVHAFAEGGGRVEVRMQRVKELGAICPAQGGCLLDALTGASVTLAQGTRLVRTDGSPHEGEAHVCCSVLDVTDPKGLEAMPGDLSAINVDGRAGQLESFGAMYVGLSAIDGERLELSEGSPGMALSFVSNANATFEHNEPPPSLYVFDELSGKWRQDAAGSLEVEGVVMPSPGSEEVFVKAEAAAPVPRPKPKKKGKKGGGDEFHATNHFGFVAGAQVWTKAEFEKLWGQKMPRKITLTKVSATGYWNCDRMMETSFVSGQIVDEKGDALSVANVFSKGVRYSGASPRSGLTVNGGFSVLTRCLSQFEVVVLVPVGGDGPAAMQEAGTRAAKGQESVRFAFGPFMTGQPGEELKLGALKLRQAAMVPPEDVQKQKVLQIFDRWDEKGKGWIGEGELTAVLRRLGVAEDEIAEIFQAADMNNDGKIDYEEFMRWVVGSEDNQKLIDKSDDVDQDDAAEE